MLYTLNYIIKMRRLRINGSEFLKIYTKIDILIFSCGLNKALLEPMYGIAEWLSDVNKYIKKKHACIKVWISYIFNILQ